MTYNLSKFTKIGASAILAALVASSFVVTAFAQTVTTRVGQLVYTTNSQGQHPVYIVGDNGLYGFPNPAVFYSWGYNFNQVVSANSSEGSLGMVAIVNAKTANCTSPLLSCGFSTVVASGSPRVGVLVYNPGNKTVFLVGNDGSLHPFSSAEIFYSWNFSFNQIMVANSSELAMPVGSLVPMMMPTCSTPMNQIAGICGPTAVTGTVAAPAISSLSPSSGAVGSVVTITGTGFSSAGNVINFDVYTFNNISSTNNGTTLTFNVPSTIFYNTCQTGKMCPNFARPTTNGNYGVTVTNQNGTSNSLVFTVTGSPGLQQ
jgi:hypothetical protein